MKKTPVLCSLLLATSSGNATVEDAAAKIQRQLQDPLANIKAVMSDNDILFKTGFEDEPSYSFSIQGLYGIALEDKGFNLMNRVIVPILGMAPGGQEPILGGPLPPGGDRTWGLSDMQLQFFFSPRSDAEWKWGRGPAISLKTRTDDKLAGAGWGAGPIAVLVGGITENLSTAIIGGHLWGDENNFSTSILEPMFLYNFPNLPGWEVQYNNTITYDWNATSGNEWTVPLGLGVGKTVMLGDVGFNIIGGYYYNVERPQGAADSMLRVSANFVFP